MKITPQEYNDTLQKARELTEKYILSERSLECIEECVFGYLYLRHLTPNVEQVHHFVSQVIFDMERIRTRVKECLA